MKTEPKSPAVTETEITWLHWRTNEKEEKKSRRLQRGWSMWAEKKNWFWFWRIQRLMIGPHGCVMYFTASHTFTSFPVMFSQCWCIVGKCLSIILQKLLGCFVMCGSFRFHLKAVVVFYSYMLAHCALLCNSLCGTETKQDQRGLELQRKMFLLHCSCLWCSCDAEDSYSQLSKGELYLKLQPRMSIYYRKASEEGGVFSVESAEARTDVHHHQETQASNDRASGTAQHRYQHKHMIIM